MSRPEGGPFTRGYMHDDADRQYSCAYFETDGTPLGRGAGCKERHLAAKLNLRDGLKILDIGSGWGGLALYLAQTAHVEVTGKIRAHDLPDVHRSAI
jgi:cyclopropane fatty-acyl-phospholipid synthase-like methyltransferase